MTTAQPELLAPAGQWDCARAAVANGANAVYFGLPQFNARMRADNFTLEELPELVSFLHDHSVKAYVTLNTLIFTDELAQAESFLLALAASRVDAIIVQDLGLVLLARTVAPEVAIHASTQMTITSPEGARYAGRLGASRVVLARETSLREMERFREPGLPPTEVFVHGALCVAYSGQCLTSESLGQRSANRGECAQACRLPYSMVVDGVLRDLGEKRYLLSPQDLAAVAEIPELIRLGVTSFKIEGRLKTPEYVAAICQVYSKAISAASADSGSRITTEDHYKLEMTFSRGLFSGWMHGVNHQELVQGRYSNKRGPLVGTISRVGTDWIEVDHPRVPLRLGDGLLMDDGGDQNRQQGGRLYQIKANRLFFAHGKIRFDRLSKGQSVYKTDDPQLEASLQKSYQRPWPKSRQLLHLTVQGQQGEPLLLYAKTGQTEVSASSTMPLEVAQRKPLTTDFLRDQLGRLGETSFILGDFENRLSGDLILPVKELNRMRRDIVEQLAHCPELTLARPTLEPLSTRGLADLLSEVNPLPSPSSPTQDSWRLNPLCRSLDQLKALLEVGARHLYVDLEDLRRYAKAVEIARDFPEATIILATPRIQKASEGGFFKLIESAEPDGVLIRNLGALDYFKKSPLRRIGDFSLNVANPLTAGLLMQEGLERITVSYDLNATQVLSLIRSAPAHWFEIVLHQHMPMFHMEHCIFAAFLSEGKDHLSCGRPCDRHDLRLRDRVGMDHPVMADVGCRNTVFHAKAQSGGGFFQDFYQAGVREYRLELLRETAEESVQIYQAYERMLGGHQTPESLFRQLAVSSQLGVTSGTLTVL